MKLDVKQQYLLSVYGEDGTILGEYFANFLVERYSIVKLHARESVADEHIAQLLGYLDSSQIETVLIVNFGAAKLHVKEYLMTVSEYGS
ncbi:GxxExxY protein [Roseiconus lacunae]|uniref:GxxExxY protein n=1 Tax=Roseiconus lacunae TaxID=2605694 RepID=UPI0033146579